MQILIDSFEIGGIVHYGTAGSANDSLSLGDVSVPSHLAFTASWKWKVNYLNSLSKKFFILVFGFLITSSCILSFKEFKSEKGQNPELKFGDFDLPNKGENLLGKVEFTPKQLYSSGKQMEELFWLPVEPKWLNVAAQLQVLRQP